jgi:hypothetical protein
MTLLAHKPARPNPPRLKVITSENDKGEPVANVHIQETRDSPDAVLATFGTVSADVAEQCVRWLTQATTNRWRPIPNEMEANAVLAIVGGMQPQNELEAVLLVQMMATHQYAMDLLARARHHEHWKGAESYGLQATRLLRTFTAQVEAFNKLRRGGTQTVRVEHVHVYPGGQAVVGSVIQAGGSGGHIEK